MHPPRARLLELPRQKSAQRQRLGWPWAFSCLSLSRTAGQALAAPDSHAKAACSWPETSSNVKIYSPTNTLKLQARRIAFFAVRVKMRLVCKEA